MNTEELTQIVTAHQQAIARREQWQIEHETTMQRIDATLERVSERLDRVAAQSDANMQQIALLTENLVQLGNFVADDIRRRNQP